MFDPKDRNEKDIPVDRTQAKPFPINPIWLAHALESEGAALAQMDISDAGDVERYEKVLQLVGKAYPVASVFAQESIENLRTVKSMNKSHPKTLCRRDDQDAYCLLYHLMNLLLRLPLESDRAYVLDLINFVEQWPEQYLHKLDDGRRSVPGCETPASGTSESGGGLPASKRYHNGKEVYTQATFSYSMAKVGDYVEEAVVDDAMDCLPPACMSRHCAQMGEPYSHREDPETGMWRATYATFKACVDAPGIWEYCGHCFRGETVERGKDPVYC